MDEETRVAALDKVDSMNSFIAYPDELLDDSKLEQYYRKMEIVQDSYLEAILSLRLFATEHSLEQLRLPVNKSDWVTYGDSAMVNAYYSPNDNSMRKEDCYNSVACMIAMCQRVCGNWRIKSSFGLISWRVSELYGENVMAA